MTNTTIMIIVVAIVIIIIILMTRSDKMVSEYETEPEKEGDNKWEKYKYKRKNFFMSRAERECFNALYKAVGNEYFIFAQVHLPTFVDYKIIGQYWKSALSHINRKSVDFVLCEKKYISPKLAIELDDKSHERPDRQERDKEVERILKYADIPLLRLKNYGQFNSDELRMKIKKIIDGREEPVKI